MLRIIRLKAVYDEVIPCSMITTNSPGLIKLYADAQNHDCVAHPIELNGKKIVDSKTNPASSGGNNYKVIVGKIEHINDFKKFSGENDHAKTDALLGIPECCSNFKYKYHKLGISDFKLPMFFIGTDDSMMSIDIKKNIDCHVFLEDFGLGIFHYHPCSPYCASSSDISRRIKHSARKNGFSKEIDWLEKMEDWPIKWSSLHGIGEVKTPLFKVIYKSDALSKKFEVRYHGQTYPADATKGTSFPYNLGTR